MADALDLTHADYRNFVQHCRECKSSFAIKTYIDDKVAKYQRDNSDIIIYLMEKVEDLQLDDFDYSGVPDENYHELDILNFAEEMPNESHPQLKVLYSYLWHLSTKKLESNQVTGCRPFLGDIDPTKSFTTFLTDKERLDLFNQMVSIKILEKNDEAMFHKIFTGQPLTEIKRIKWLPPYRKGANMLLLFELLKHLCEHEYLDAARRSTFLEKVNLCFKDWQGRELDIENLRPNFTRWKRRRFYTTDVLNDNDKYKSQPFLLLQYMKNQGLIQEKYLHGLVQ